MNYYDLLCLLSDSALTLARDKVIINVQATYYNKKDVYRWLGRFASNIAGVVIWNKTNPVLSANVRDDGTCSVSNAFEYFVFLTKDGNQFRCYGDKTVLNVITSGVNQEHFKNHHAVMRKDIAEWFIQKFTKPGDLVLDPFMGLGTTALVCDELNRDYLGFEIVPEYAKASAERVQKGSQIKLSI